jgi:hypothetical protein
MNTSTDLDYSFGQALMPDLYVNYLAEGRLMVVTGRAFSRLMVDVWYKTTAAHMANWQEGTPYLSVLDLDTSKMAVSPYST